MLSCFKNLPLYLKNHKTVLLVGKHGVGKTAIIKELFQKEFGDNYKYFSAATLDPFVDFVGVPQKIEDKNGAYLDMVMPKYFRKDNEVEAIFLDEFNRSAPKIRNATMELLQFKSLNGVKFEKLKVIWACCNPSDEGLEYDVEKLDPALMDRFEIIIDVPYNLDLDYFKDKYPNKWEAAAEWWQDLTPEVKNSVSPRRLEYALQIHDIGGDLRQVLPKNTNISKLVDGLKFGTTAAQLNSMLNATEEEIKEKFKNVNMVTKVAEKLDNKEYYEKFSHLIPEEILTKQAQHNYDLCQHIKQNSNKFNTSLIANLENLGYFKESEFRVCFGLLNKDFSDGLYNSKRRKKIVAIFKAMPTASSNIKINQADLPNLQKLINITNLYIQKSYYQTSHSDDAESNFIQKFSTIRKLRGNELNFSGYYINSYLNRFDQDQERKQTEAQAALSSQVYTT